MCGEHRSIVGIGVACQGSSPHVRGARRPRQPGIRPNGIIPACAGSTQVRLRRRPWTEDHPRMCGEHRSGFNALFFLTGSSPHVRGARKDSPLRRCHSGIIPACAGSTGTLASTESDLGDHPRMCGEHVGYHFSPAVSLGSSPHVRGALMTVPKARQLLGIIPACAGSTMQYPQRRVVRRDHPRMCGEHFICASIFDISLGSSPHVRGAHFENSIIPRKRKDNWLFFIQFRFENFLAFRYLLALLHPFLGVPTKDPSFASLGRLINCNPSQSTGDQSAPYTLKAICCSFLAE